METGTVKWFNSQKGFGFITPDDGGGDVFIRPQDARAAGLLHLEQGLKVTFNEVGNEGGKVSATNIKLEFSRRQLGQPA